MSATKPDDLDCQNQGRGRPIDLAGQRFGRLVAVSPAPSKTKNRGLYWLCHCDCGNTITTAAASLKSGGSTSCGCKRVEMLLVRNEGLKKHGMHMTPTYLSWRAMLARCLRPTAPDYDRYGGRGIKVCAGWASSFEAFFADMGVRPEGTTLDRIDVDGHYEPGNCRWATRKEQDRNKRTTKILTCNGVSASMAEWVERTGINSHTLQARIRRGWTHEYALTAPIGSPRG